MVENIDLELQRNWVEREHLVVIGLEVLLARWMDEEITQLQWRMESYKTGTRNDNMLWTEKQLRQKSAGRRKAREGGFCFHSPNLVLPQASPSQWLTLISCSTQAAVSEYFLPPPISKSSYQFLRILAFVHSSFPFRWCLPPALWPISLSLPWTTATGSSVIPSLAWTIATGKITH